MKARLLAAAVLIAVAVAVWRDLRSPISRSLREGEPVTALLSMRFEGQGDIVPPALYLAVYGRPSGSLELVHILPSTETLLNADSNKVRTLADHYGDTFHTDGDAEYAAAKMAEEARSLLQADPVWPKGPEGSVPLGFELAMKLPGRSRPAFSGELKQALAARLQRPLFWIDMIKAAHKRPFTAMRPAALYDIFLITKELRRLKPENIHISRLPVSDLIQPFLGGVFRRASGREEPPAEMTVEVLNATDVSGVALRATKILRLRGFDVVHFGNARLKKGQLPPRRTRFRDYTGRVGGAKAVAKALGCSDPEMLTVLEKQTRASVSVMIGLDFERCSRLKP